MAQRKVDAKIMAGRKPTVRDLIDDLDNGFGDSIMLVSYELVETAIDKHGLDEDYSARWYDGREEMDSLMAEARAEFQ